MTILKSYYSIQLSVHLYSFVIFNVCKIHPYLTGVLQLPCACEFVYPYCSEYEKVTKYYCNIHYRPPENNPDLSHHFDPLLFSSLSLTYTNQTIHQLLPPSTDLSHGQAFLYILRCPLHPSQSPFYSSNNVLFVPIHLPSLHHMAVSLPVRINFNQ